MRFSNNSVLKIIFLFLFLSIMSFLNIFLHLNEGFISGISDAFCKVYSGGNLETQCGALTQGNCGKTSCCVWTSDNKCKSGNVNGPTFNTNVAGKTNALNYYYFQGKCYGSNCPINNI